MSFLLPYCTETLPVVTVQSLRLVYSVFLCLQTLVIATVMYGMLQFLGILGGVHKNQG